MEKMPADSSLMLVGVLPAKKDFEIARLLGWYRIPLRMAPKVVDVDYLAFYQTGVFGNASRWQIKWFAEVKGHELTTRRELIRNEPDHPRANEEYYKVQLGPLQSREEPILADKWKRITFLYTTGQLFNRAKIINDLVVRSGEREVFWRNLRERADQAEQYLKGSEKGNSFINDPAMLEFFGSFLLDTDDDEDSALNI
jgi:hypothetical protein